MRPVAMHLGADLRWSVEIYSTEATGTSPVDILWLLSDGLLGKIPEDRGESMGNLERFGIGTHRLSCSPHSKSLPFTKERGVMTAIHGFMGLGRALCRTGLDYHISYAF